MTTELSGVLTALATPFTADEAIDAPVLHRLIDRTIDGGVDGVVVGGSTGEFAALSSDERRQLVDAVVEHTDGRVPVIAQTGATTTAEAVRLSRAAQTAGADVLMLVTPYYEPLTVDETVAYIRDVAAAVDVPVMLYNIPGATGVNLDAATIGALARDVDTIRYVKDSSANWEQALQLIHHHGDHVGTFIGWDAYIFSALSEGAAGVMAGTANVVPREIVEVHRLIAAGDHANALIAWNRVYPVIDAMLSAPFIPAVKTALRALGEPVGLPRRPTADVTPAVRAHLETALSTLSREAAFA
jgi:4-hydroxy-tetrahydrodipicolinate synthase